MGMRFLALLGDLLLLAWLSIALLIRTVLAAILTVLRLIRLLMARIMRLMRRIISWIDHVMSWRLHAWSTFRVWGPRCREVEQGCPCCDHWDEHDRIFERGPYRQRREVSRPSDASWDPWAN
ncbi:hypothetical protein ACEUZ9_002893 [Paracoccus litorisediminis]|uniref:hypothetical protein n=1 Tax=Paracoccus litorisediminis TaxID=2006130 RepID=UPI0037314A51